MAQLSGMADGTTQSDYANARVDASSGALVETDPWSSGQPFKALMQKYNENWSEFAADNPAMAKLGVNGKVPAGQTIAIRANHFTAYAHNPYTGTVNGFPPPTAIGAPPKLPTGGAPIAPPLPTGGAPIAPPPAAPTVPTDPTVPADPTDTSGTDPTLGADPTDPTDTSGTDPSTLGGSPAAPTDSGANPTDPTSGTDPSTSSAATTGSTDQQTSGGTGTVASTSGAASTDSTDQQSSGGTGTVASTSGAATTDTSLGADPTDTVGDSTDPTDSTGTDASTSSAAATGSTDQQSSGGTGTVASTSGAATTDTSLGADPTDTVGDSTDPTDSNSQFVAGGTHAKREEKRTKGSVFGIKSAIANLTSKATGFRSTQAKESRDSHTLASTITEPNISSLPQSASLPSAADQTYTVAPGNTMSEIAQTHGISLASLEAANPSLRDPNLIFPGQVIHMPSNGTASSGDASSFPTRSTYPPGDTLSSSSQPHGTDTGSTGGGSITGGASPFGSGAISPEHKSSQTGDSAKKPGGTSTTPL